MCRGIIVRFHVSYISSSFVNATSIFEFVVPKFDPSAILCAENRAYNFG